MRRTLALTAAALALTACGGNSPKSAQPTTSATPSGSTTASATSASPSSSATSSAAPSTATTFVGTRDGRVAVFDLATGALQKFLTNAEPGGGAQDVVRTADGTVWWVQGSGTCASSIEVLRDGKRSTFYGDGVSYGLAVSRDGKAVAWLHQHDCTSGFPELRVAKPGTTFAKAFEMPNPPVIQGSPSWAGDDTHLAYFLRTGNQGAVHVIDVTRDTRIEQGSSSSAPDCRWMQPRYRADGRLVVLSCTPDAMGTSAAVLDVAKSSVGPPLFTLQVPNDQVTTFSLSADGRQALLEADGTVSRWDGSAVTTVRCNCHSPSY